MNAWYYPGLVLGSASIILSGYLCFLSFLSLNICEMFTGLAQVIWLYGNQWWQVYYFSKNFTVINLIVTITIVDDHDDDVVILLI